MTSAPEQPAGELSLTDPATYPRKVLFVAGAGRSGTSTMAGLMRIMGLHVPQPEVVADDTNPKGFGEPRWVVDHHDRLLKEALVQVSDSRPEAWFETGRVFVRYEDLLDDWVKTSMHVAETLQLQHVLHADSEQIREGHRFVDPGLRRMSQTLEDLALPKRLHELTAATWEELNKLADPGGDTPEVQAALDQLREAYVDLYEESAAISRSSVVAAEQRIKRLRPAAPQQQRGVDRIPHGVRAAIPPSVRKGLRKIAGRERPQ